MNMMKRQLMQNIIGEMQNSANFQKAITIESVDNGFIINKLHLREEEVPKAYLLNPGIGNSDPGFFPMAEDEDQGGEEPPKKVHIPTIRISVAKDAAEALDVVKTYLEMSSLVLKEKK